MLWGVTGVKAACKYVDEIDHWSRGTVGHSPEDNVTHKKDCS